MATLIELRNAITQLLNNCAGAPNFILTLNDRAKAYEAYVFGLCVRAIREQGIVPTAHKGTGPGSFFIFRGAPGKIYSRPNHFGFVSFSKGGTGYEVHAGVQFAGLSGMLHELDVSILSSNSASQCRAKKQNPVASSLLGGWECKFWTARLDKSAGRAFVGLVDDFKSTVRIKGFCSNLNNAELNRYFAYKNRPDCHFKLVPKNKAVEIAFVKTLKAAIKAL